MSTLGCVVARAADQPAFHQPGTTLTGMSLNNLHGALPQYSVNIKFLTRDGRLRLPFDRLVTRILRDISRLKEPSGQGRYISCRKLYAEGLRCSPAGLGYTQPTYSFMTGLGPSVLECLLVLGLPNAPGKKSGVPGWCSDALVCDERRNSVGIEQTWLG